MRYLPEFEWDEANEQKLLDSHDVSAREAEECFAHPHTKKRSGDAMLMLGMTDGGRMLFLGVPAQVRQSCAGLFGTRDD